jgi:hypothetical protein
MIRNTEHIKKGKSAHVSYTNSKLIDGLGKTVGILGMFL